MKMAKKIKNFMLDCDEVDDDSEKTTCEKMRGEGLRIVKIRNINSGTRLHWLRRWMV
jgi:hypothetical protein